MNTPAHLILGLAAFGKPGRPRMTAAALAGGLIPDLSLSLLAGGSLAVGTPAETVFRERYCSDLWQGILAVENSVFVWGAVPALGLRTSRAWVVALAGAGLLHLACDLPLHHDDGRAHFRPVWDAICASPYSCWDVAHGAGWIAPLEVARCAMAAIRLRRRRAPAGMQVLLATVWRRSCRSAGSGRSSPPRRAGRRRGSGGAAAHGRPPPSAGPSRPRSAPRGAP